MSQFSAEVEVTFVDDATGKAFGVTKVSPADLPESFELDTTLHLGDDDWSVVDAQPNSRAAYAKSKTLTLRLRRIEMVDPNKLLFSLPSICDAIPAVGDQPLRGGEFVLAEDDWRQFEFVSHELADVVDDEIAKIRSIHETAVAEVGWREIHVRTRPEPPLHCDFTLDDLRHVLKVSTESAGVTYRGAPTRITDGYSFSTNDGLSLYGVAPNGRVQVVALPQSAALSPNPESIDRLKSLAQNWNLDLVYWCRCIRVRPDDPLFDRLISNEAV